MSQTAELKAVLSMTEDNSSMEKKPRKRLKKLMVDICQQIEFYFSDANLRKDRFLKQEITKSSGRYVSLDVIASFNRIKTMTEDRKMVTMAIQQSAMLELSKDQTMLRRREGLKPPKYDPDDCTIYVECLPKRVDHEWLRKTFSYCGNVVYISLPRYKSTGDNKGFAFVEFENPEEADKACQHMNNPPPDSTARAGKFPKMKGRRRIVPIEFDLHERLEGRPGKGRDKDHGVSHTGHNKERVVLEGTKRTRSSENQDLAETGKQKRKLGEEDDDNGNDCIVNPVSDRKVPDSDIGGSSVTEKDHGNVDTGAKGVETKMSRKRRREDVREEASKSAKTQSSPVASNVVTSQTRKQGNMDKTKRETFEQRRLKIIQGGGKPVKRKRSLSEGDMWEVRYEQEAGDNDGDSGSDSEEKVIKKLKGEPSDNEGHKKVEGADGDGSSRSELEKKKRSRKKKLRRMLEEEEALFLRVIPKSEWLELKQEYLSLQKESLACMKQSLRKEYSTYTNRHPISGTNTTSHPQVSSPSEVCQEPDSSNKVKSKEPEFIEGTVMRLQCLQPAMSRKHIKEHLEPISAIAYIDLPEGDSEGYVRFQSSEGPRAVLQESRLHQLAQLHISLSVITGEEEKAYWQKLRLDRENKLNSKQKKKKRKGVNKILQKADKALSSKETSHVRFDD